MLAALRRLAVVLVSTPVVVGAVALLLGVLAGWQLARAVSVAFYVVGAFLVVLGFFMGNRGPLRPRGNAESEPITGLFGMGIALRGARTASSAERQDSLATAGIMLGVGLWLIFLGIAVDTSVEVL